MTTIDPDPHLLAMANSDAWRRVEGYEALYRCWGHEVAVDVCARLWGRPEALELQRAFVDGGAK